MAGIDAVPCASASRRPPGSLLAWNNFFPTWVSLTPSGHTVRSCGTCPGRPCGTCPGRPCGTCPGRRPAALALAGALRHLPWPAPCGTPSGISLFDSTGYSTHRPRNQLRGVATCRSGASARAAPDRWRPVRPLSLLESMLFPARQRPGAPGRKLLCKLSESNPNTTEQIAAADCKLGRNRNLVNVF